MAGGRSKSKVRCKGGRKRVLNARRRARTRAERSPADFGTPELQKKRKARTGEGGNEALCAHALGLLLSDGLITLEQHDAAWIFAARRYLAFGRPFARCPEYSDLFGLNYDADSEPALIEEKRRLARLSYVSADEALKSRGRDVRSAVQDIAIYQRIPHWFMRAREGQPGSGDERAHSALLDGLDVLVTHFTRGEGKIRA